MHKIGALLKLFRWQNLIMVALTQYLFRYCIIQALFNSAGKALAITHLDFFLLVLATVLISAAGYAINDYFDLRIDRINKPERIIVGRLINRRSAILSHWILSTAGVIIGVYLSWKVQYWPVAIIFMLVPLVLWLYSIRFKRSFFIGNLTVAALSAMIIGLVWLVEFRAVSLQFEVGELIYHVNSFTWLYAFFAFFTTFIREIIKDMEDYAGDKKIGCRSVAIVLGLKPTHDLVMALLILLMSFVGLYAFILGTQTKFVLLFYFLFLVLLPLAYLLLQVKKTHNYWDFGFIQRMLKLIMLAGVLSMAVQFFYI